MMSKLKMKHILLVEDNEGDIVLTTEAIEESKIDVKISIARDGEQAIHFLKGEGIFKNAELPDLILLDINIPKKNGHEVLEYIKKNEKTKHIPVVMLTTSSSNKDIVSAYAKHANCYLVKAHNAEDFFELIAGLENFWFNLAQLPTHYQDDIDDPH